MRIKRVHIGENLKLPHKGQAVKKIFVIPTVTKWELLRHTSAYIDRNSQPPAAEGWAILTGDPNQNKYTPLFILVPGLHIIHPFLPQEQGSSTLATQRNHFFKCQCLGHHPQTHMRLTHTHTHCTLVTGQRHENKDSCCPALHIQTMLCSVTS